MTDAQMRWSHSDVKRLSFFVAKAWALLDSASREVLMIDGLSKGLNQGPNPRSR